MRRFGFDDGDSDVNFRRLVRDLHGLRAGSRVGVFLRSVFVYRGQTGLLVLAFLAFALTFALSRLRGGGADDLVSRFSSLAPALDWMKAHDEMLEYVGEGLLVVGLAAVLVNLWRAASFTGLLFRGLRMLQMDLRERRKELDASAARLERRVAALQMEADSAQSRAETLTRKAGGAAAPRRAEGPAFLATGESRETGARTFLAELGRSMSAGAKAAPQRLVLALDGLDTLTPAEARRFLETARRLAGPGIIVVAAADVARLGADARDFGEGLFDAAFDVEALGASAGLRGAGFLLEAPTPAAAADPKMFSVTEPLDAPEVEFSQNLGGADRPASAHLEAVLQRLSSGAHGRRSARGAGAVAGDADGPGPGDGVRLALDAPERRPVRGPGLPGAAAGGVRGAVDARSRARRRARGVRGGAAVCAVGVKSLLAASACCVVRSKGKKVGGKSTAGPWHLALDLFSLFELPIGRCTKTQRRVYFLQPHFRNSLRRFLNFECAEGCLVEGEEKNDDLIASTFASLLVELFFAALPLFILSLTWPSKHEEHPTAFIRGPEISMTSCILYGLTLTRYYEGILEYLRLSAFESKDEYS